MMKISARSTRLCLIGIKVRSNYLKDPLRADMENDEIYVSPG
jgi:hypothetical protein